tara:strand:+ start:371 stop:757 length:387 start_codon:yes stop_codon:yes gene_type:complete
MTLLNGIKYGLIYLFVLLLIITSTSFNSFAEEINWIEVSKIDNELVFIDPNSIKYNNKGLLSVITKYSEINPENLKITNSDSFLMAFDCENRLYSKLPVNGDLKQVKSWKNPIGNKLIKKTIVNSCSY